MLAPFLLQKHINRRKRVKRRLCGFYYQTRLFPTLNRFSPVFAACDGL